MLPKCCQAIEGHPWNMVSPERLPAAKKRFTRKNIEVIRGRLNPPPGYDLEGDLSLAVFCYHLYSEHDFVRGLSHARQRDKLAEVGKKAGELLALLCDKQTRGLIIDLSLEIELLHELAARLERLLKICDEQGRGLPQKTAGRPADKGQHDFFVLASGIHKAATGRLPSASFCEMCFDLLIGPIDNRNARRVVSKIKRKIPKPA
jgi:hypothetical protein